MAIIAMCVYDTVENKRTEYTRQTLLSLLKTVNFNKHRLIIVDNGSCKETKDFLNMGFIKAFAFGAGASISIITSDTNLGTAEGINLAWKYRKSGEHAIKMDNDVIIHQKDWADDLEEAIRRDARIGIVGLKRKDCWENPSHKDEFYRSELYMLPHQPGEKWMIGEKVNHVMGTCQMYSSALLDKIGYLQQPNLYGFDDSWAAVRCKLAGFINVFLPYINIDHIDAGDTPYQSWKEQHAGACWTEYHETIAAWKSGVKSIYYNPFKTN